MATSWLKWLSVGDRVTEARHLVTVWNPSYANDAMDAHLRVLLRVVGVRSPMRETVAALLPI